MSLTTEIEKTKRGLSLEKRCGSVQTGTPFGYMYGKLRHRPKTFTRVQDSKGPFSSSNYSNNREVRICPAVAMSRSHKLITLA